MESKKDVFACVGRPKLVVDVKSGRLFVRGWDGDEVRVERGEGDQSQVRNKGDKIIISKSHCHASIYMPRNSNITVDGSDLDVDMAGLNGSAYVDLSSGNVLIQDWQGNVEVDTGSGSVQLDRVEGQVEVDTGAGNVQLTAISGNISVDTGAGKVEVAESKGSLAVDTGDGSVTISHYRGPIAVDTGAGEVKIKDVVGRNVHVDTGKGDIQANLPGGNPGRWRLETSSGAINLSVPENVSARFEFHGQDLDVDDLNLEQSQRDRDEIYGIINQGLGRVFVASASGIVKAVGSQAMEIDQQPKAAQDEESLKILTMLEQGTISTEEAEKLLDALMGGNDNE